VSAGDGGPAIDVAIRVAASGSIGAGHAARTAAVAHALAAIGTRVRFACDAATARVLAERAVPTGWITTTDPIPAGTAGDESEASPAAQVVDAASTLDAVRGDWMLVDSYRLGATWHRAVRASGVRVAAFDDLCDRPIGADLVINAARAAADYARLAPEAMVLGGLEYAVIGDPARPAAAGLGSILLSFGAADAAGLTAATLRELATRRGFAEAGSPPIAVQLGTSAPGRTEVERLLAGTRGSRMADGPTSPGTPLLSIGAAGVGLLERLQAGVPCVVVVAAQNQSGLARAAAAAGAAIVVDSVQGACDAAERLLADDAGRARLAAAARAAVDGRGAARIARAIGRLAGVALRRATMDDAALLHAWRNDPSVRAVSHNPGEIAFADHCRWLEASLARTDRHVLVAERRGAPVGTLRFDVAGGRATVSIAVDPRFRGSGIGPAILDAGHAWIAANAPSVAALRAEIRPGNEASARAFLAAGYLPGNDAYERPVGRGSST